MIVTCDGEVLALHLSASYLTVPRCRMLLFAMHFDPSGGLGKMASAKQ